MTAHSSCVCNSVDSAEHACRYCLNCAYACCIHLTGHAQTKQVTGEQEAERTQTHSTAFSQWHAHTNQKDIHPFITNGPSMNPWNSFAFPLHTRSIQALKEAHWAFLSGTSAPNNNPRDSLDYTPQQMGTKTKTSMERRQAEHKGKKQTQTKKGRPRDLSHSRKSCECW